MHDFLRIPILIIVLEISTVEGAVKLVSCVLSFHFDDQRGTSVNQTRLFKDHESEVLVNTILESGFDLLFDKLIQIYLQSWYADDAQNG